MKYLILILLTGCSTFADRCTPLKGEEKYVCIETFLTEEAEYNEEIGL